MRCFFPRWLCAAGSTVVWAVSALASPVNGKLLSLVPPGCAIVAGFENGHGPHAAGRLLLTTPNNRFDLDDWLAIAGVDTGRRYDEVVEVAALNSRGNLSEHLLLVAGRFDKERIFRSAQQNGAQTSQDEGEAILIVRPFSREQRQMADTRWLAILNNRTAVFGTPLLVEQALRRYASHADADSVLMQRLRVLRPDISSWNVLGSWQASAPDKNMNMAIPHSVWAHLLEDADVLMVGAHFGSGIRIDFSVDARGERQASFFNRKAALFSSMFTGEPVEQGESSPRPEPRLENLSVDAGRVQGSVVLTDKQFEDWIAHPGPPQAPPTLPRATAIAETR